MKPLISILVFLLTLPLFPIKKDSLAITVGAGFRLVTEDSFKDIFGSTNPVFSLDICLELKKNIALFLHTDYFSAKGETSSLKDQVSWRLIPVEVGGRYFFGDKIRFFGGLGGGIYLYKEEVTFSDTTSETSGSQAGFFGELGSRIPISKTIFVSISAKYHLLTIKPKKKSDSDGDSTIYYNQNQSLAGFSILAGIGILI